MFKRFLQTTVLLLMLLSAVPSLQASGKMEVPIGGQISFSAEQRGSRAEFKWVVTKDSRILASKTERELTYLFNEQGEHVVSLTITEGAKIERSQLIVLSGETFARQQLQEDYTLGGVYGPSGIRGSSEGGGTFGRPLELKLSTLPARSADKKLHLMGAGKVLFDASASTGDILEYRIDQNVFQDSDGNGVANDDIDNSNHPSYLTGRPWTAFYSDEGTAQADARITLVDKQGKKVQEQIQIAFDPLPDRTGPPVAKWSVSPSADPKSGTAYLYGDEAEVSFYAKPSTGRIFEFRIDTNIFVDSNKDGDPANDIDNLDDPSFKTGDIFRTTYQKTDDAIIAQLIVVGEGGKGSRIQQGLAFTDQPAAPEPASQVIRIEADKEFVRKGDPIHLQVVGLQQQLKNYTFTWDLDGDSGADKIVEGDNTLQHLYDETGTFDVTVTIQDSDGNSADRKLSILVKEDIKTEASFTYVIQDGKVLFENKSIADARLADKTLTYDWNFSDTNEVNFRNQQEEKRREAPEYSYAEPGVYRVTLTVTDKSGVISETSQEIGITEAMAVPLPEGGEPSSEAEGDQGAQDVKPEKAPKSGSLVVRILKIMLYVLIGVIALLVLSLGGMIAAIKLQHPDLPFDETIEEVKIKILGMLGIHEHEVEAVAGRVAPSGPAEPAPAEPTVPEEEVTEGEVTEGEVSQPPPPPPQAAEPPPAPEPEPQPRPDPAPGTPEQAPAQAAPGKPPEKEDDLPTGQAGSPKPPKSGGGATTEGGSGPVPDWLKNA